jgi:hypothetical protein
MSIVHQSPYIYISVNDINTCVTLVNHHSRICTYFTTDEYGLGVDLLKTMAQEEANKLIAIHGERYFNVVKRERNEQDGTDFYTVSLDAPSSVEPTAILKFSADSQLMSKDNNTSFFNLVTRRQWKVSPCRDGRIEIATYTISILNETVSLNSLLYDAASHVMILHDSSNRLVFDYREGKYSLHTLELYNKATRISTASTLPLTRVLECLYRQSSERRRETNHAECNNIDKLHELYEQFKNEKLYIIIKTQYSKSFTVTKRDSVLIKVRSAYAGHYSKKEKSFPNGTPHDVVQNFINTYTKLCATSVYMKHMYLMLDGKGNVPDFVSQRCNPTDQELMSLLHKHNISGKTSATFAYIQNGKIRQETLYSASPSTALKKVKQLLKHNVYLMRYSNRKIQFDVEFFLCGFTVNIEHGTQFSIFDLIQDSYFEEEEEEEKEEKE